jgi:hypothetical protein
MPPPCRGSVKCVDWATPWVPTSEAYHTPVALREVLCASGNGPLAQLTEASHMALIYEE